MQLILMTVWIYQGNYFSSGYDQLWLYPDDEYIYSTMYSNVLQRIQMYINKH